MADRYRLLKDLPDSKAGDVYVYVPEQQAYYKNGDINDSYWLKANVENQSGWFEKIKEVECITILFHPKERYEVNREIFDNIMFKNYIIPEPKPEEKLYTEEDMRKSFYAGRSGSFNQFGATFFHGNFDCYLQSLNNK